MKQNSHKSLKQNNHHGFILIPRQIEEKQQQQKVVRDQRTIAFFSITKLELYATASKAWTRKKIAATKITKEMCVNDSVLQESNARESKFFYYNSIIISRNNLLSLIKLLFWVTGERNSFPHTLFCSSSSSFFYTHTPVKFMPLTHSNVWM